MTCCKNYKYWLKEADKKATPLLEKVLESYTRDNNVFLFLKKMNPPLPKPDFYKILRASVEEDNQPFIAAVLDVLIDRYDF